MKICLLVFLIAINIHTVFSQSPSPHGTLIVAAICDDGILLCADSRASWAATDSNTGKLVYFAHLDSINKIFSLGKFKLAISGRDSYKDLYYDQLIREYNHKKIKDSTVFGTFGKFMKYLNHQVGMTALDISKTNFYIGGYEKGKPVFYAKDSLNSYFLSPGMYIPSDDACRKFLKPPHKPDCNSALKSFKEMYSFFETQEISVGGPLQIIKIDSNNVVTSMEQPFKFRRTYKKVSNFSKDVLNGTIPIVYHYPNSKDFLFIVLKKALKNGF